MASNRACKCLSCEDAYRETINGLTYLVCGEEACLINCSSCSSRPLCTNKSRDASRRAKEQRQSDNYFSHDFGEEIFPKMV